VQEPIHAIHIGLGYVDFFREDMHRHYVWSTIDISVVSGMAAKNNHAMRCHAKNSGHLWISRRLNKQIKLRGIPVKVGLQEFLLVIQSSKAKPCAQPRCSKSWWARLAIVARMMSWCWSILLSPVITQLLLRPLLAGFSILLAPFVSISDAYSPTRSLPQFPDRECPNIGHR
jgi:hypothetical protein